MLENNQGSPPTQGLTQITEALTLGATEDFLQNTPRKTIDGLKDCTEQASYIVFATIKHIIDDDDWWYTACVCTKGVYPDSKMFFCVKCNKHVMKVIPRYRIKVRVIDSTDSATFVIFDRDCEKLFNISCANLFEMNERREGPGGWPREINDLVDKSFLFKVEYKTESSSKYEQSFKVKKNCDDPSIINKFNEAEVKSVDVQSATAYVGSGKEAIIHGTCIDLAEDLMPKFSSYVVDLESQNSAVEVSIADKDDTPQKSELPKENGKSKAGEEGIANVELPLKYLKKKIKIDREGIESTHESKDYFEQLL